MTAQGKGCRAQQAQPEGAELGIWGVFHCSTLLRLTLYIVWGQNLGISGECFTLLNITYGFTQTALCKSCP